MCHFVEKNHPPFLITTILIEPHINGWLYYFWKAIWDTVCLWLSLSERLIQVHLIAKLVNGNEKLRAPFKTSYGPCTCILPCWVLELKSHLSYLPVILNFIAWLKLTESLGALLKPKWFANVAILKENYQPQKLSFLGHFPVHSFELTTASLKLYIKLST